MSIYCLCIQTDSVIYCLSHSYTSTYWFIFHWNILTKLSKILKHLICQLTSWSKNRISNEIMFQNICNKELLQCNYTSNNKSDKLLKRFITFLTNCFWPRISTRYKKQFFFLLHWSMLCPLLTNKLMHLIVKKLLNHSKTIYYHAKH